MLLKKCLGAKCLEPTRLRNTSLQNTSLPTFRTQKVSRSEVSRTDQTSRDVAPRHFFTNIQEAKSGLERSVPNQRDFETLRSETLLYQHSGGRKWIGAKCPEPTRQRDTSLRDTSLPTFRRQKVARSEVSRTDQTSRHVAPRHFFTNTQEARSGSERSVSN